MHLPPRARRHRRLAGLGAAGRAGGVRRPRSAPQPWSHQAQAAELAHAGRDVVVATGTASGKSLAYQLPVLAGVRRRPPGHRALPLADEGAGRRPAPGARRARPARRPGRPPFDGDTPLDASATGPAGTAGWLFSNPDMLHRSLLPRHGRWARFLRRLRYVVIDECHTYRGVFGSHVALLLRRLLRICARYGARPDDRARLGDGGRAGRVRLPADRPARSRP